MPSTSGPRIYENHLPSFMTVYDMDASAIEGLGVVPLDKSPSYMTQQSTVEEAQPRAGDPSLHQHRESTSTQASDSTDSSPTTTISTIDSSSLSDPSPSSSPESPLILLPLSSFSGSTFGLDSFQGLKMTESMPVRAPASNERPMTSPGPRKPKNIKSLALNLNSTPDAEPTFEQPSPAFIKPPTLKGRRKPSLLSLNTGAANTKTSALESLASPTVPTMLQRRSLKHSISSPQMLATPGFAPLGGMTLGNSNPPRLIGRLKDSNLGAGTFTITEDAHEQPQMATRIPGVSVGGDSFDRPPTGEDAKSPSYPEGPILMYEPSVHLYLEPKLEEARKFDVVINVAREVKNPFEEAAKAASDTKLTVLSPPPVSASREQVFTPDTAASYMSFQTAYEVQPSPTESSPSTPRPSEAKVPEYFHIPWDHNTDVKDELWDLCQMIESRTKEGKRVLVHCQQGASRSATLIIAYGMYINQDLSATEAYSRAQAKSRWVNPNMSLLFSLNDFKKIIEQKKAENNTVWKSKHRPSLSADTLDPPQTPSRVRGNSSPGSVPRDITRPAIEERKKSTSISDTTIQRLADFDFGFDETPKKQPVPEPTAESHVPIESRQVVEAPASTESEWDSLMSPRVAEMTAAPSLFSPRTFEYPRSSFFSTIPVALPPTEDPRSPPTHGEVPITRSIDDFL